MFPDCEIHGAQCGQWHPEEGMSLEAAAFSPKFSGMVLGNAIRTVCARNFISLRTLAKQTMLSYRTLWRHSNGGPIRRASTFDHIMVQLVIFEQERLRRVRHA